MNIPSIINIRTLVLAGEYISGIYNISPSLSGRPTANRHAPLAQH